MHFYGLFLHMRCSIKTDVLGKRIFIYVYLGHYVFMRSTEWRCQPFLLNLHLQYVSVNQSFRDAGLLRIGWGISCVCLRSYFNEFSLHVKVIILVFHQTGNERLFFLALLCFAFLSLSFSFCLSCWPSQHYGKHGVCVRVWSLTPAVWMLITYHGCSSVTLALLS